MNVRSGIRFFILALVTALLLTGGAGVASAELSVAQLSKTGLTSPNGTVAVGPDGKIYVGRNGAIDLYTEAGAFSRQLVSSSNWHIAVNRHGELYVVDRSNRAIKRYDSSGNLLNSASFGNYQPNHVAFDSSDNVYVITNGSAVYPYNNPSSYNLYKFTRTLGTLPSPLIAFGGKGPKFVAIDNANSKIFVLQSYVSNSASVREIERYDMSGVFEGLLSNGGASNYFGPGAGQITQSLDMIIDSQGYLYVSTNGSDNRTNKVVVLASATGALDTEIFDGNNLYAYGLGKSPEGRLAVVSRNPVNEALYVFGVGSYAFMQASPASLSFTTTGGDLGPKDITVSNSGVGDITSYTITPSDTWISASGSPSTINAGTSSTVSVSVLPGSLAQGTYNGTILITDNFGETETVKVSFEVTAVSTHDLTISTSGSGSGTVTATGINCGSGGSDCTESYSAGTPVTLTATADIGSMFAGWSGDADCTDGSVTMNDSVSCTATFSPVTHQLSVSRSGAGTVTGTGISCGADCTESYAPGAQVTLTAAADAGSMFVGWSGACSGSGTCNLTMNSAKSVTAYFAPSTETVTWTPDNNGVLETCVTNARQLESALLEAGSDTGHNRIRIAAGTYKGLFGYSAADNNNLEIIGGWDSKCAYEAFMPDKVTALDGDLDGDGTGDGVVLDLMTIGSGSITVKGIQAKNGYNAADEGGCIRVATVGGSAEVSRVVASSCAAIDGGGIWVESESGPITVTSALSHHNSATSTGGGIGIASNSGNILVLNNTVADNASNDKAGGLMVFKGSSTGAVDVQNSIFRNNTATNGCANVDLTSGSSTVTFDYNDVNLAAASACKDSGSFSSTPNIVDVDPGFLNPATGDYHIPVTSPVKDAGNTGHAQLPIADFEGNPRVVGTNINVGNVDIGADEYYVKVATAGLGSDKASPGVLGAVGTIRFTASSTGGYGDPVYQFWLYDPKAKTWTIKKGYSSDNYWDWTPDTDPGTDGRYNVVVYVKNNGSPALREMTASMQYTIYRPNRVTAIRVTGPTSTSVGTSVTFTASVTAGGAGSYEYQFWLYDYTLKTWTMKQGHSTANTWNWTPTVSGSYAVQVYARNAGSDIVLEAVGQAQVNVSNALIPVSGVSLTASRPSPAALSGGNVTFTANVTQGGSGGPYEYQFWIYDYNTSTWTAQQGYSTTNTWSWAPAASGSYQVLVYARNAGSKAAYEATKYIPYSFISVTPAVGTVTVSGPKTGTVGTGMTFTATAGGGSGSYEYRFWLYDSAAKKWTSMQSYGVGNSWMWTPTTAGTYTVQVYARNVGNNVLYEKTGQLTVTVSGP